MPAITQIVVNYPPGWRAEVEAIVGEVGVGAPVTYVEAGPTRQRSVAAMVRRCENDSVLVHETARPLVRAADFQALIDDRRDNVSSVSPLTSTVVPVDAAAARVTGHLDRASLRGVRFPQKFRRTDLLDAHEWAEQRGLAFTEDATMCAAAGKQVFFVDSVEPYFKLTTELDLRLAEHLLRDREHDLDAALERS